MAMLAARMKPAEDTISANEKKREEAKKKAQSQPSRYMLCEYELVKRSIPGPTCTSCSSRCLSCNPAGKEVKVKEVVVREVLVAMQTSDGPKEDIPNPLTINERNTGAMRRRGRRIGEDFGGGN